MAGERAGTALEKTGAAGGLAKMAAIAGPPASAMARLEEHGQWTLLQGLPMRLSVRVPLPRFRVRDLLALRPETVVASEWSSSEDVPLRVSGAKVFWCEFEVLDQAMAVRLTRLQ